MFLQYLNLRLLLGKEGEKTLMIQTAKEILILKTITSCNYTLLRVSYLSKVTIQTLGMVLKIHFKNAKT